MHLAAPLRSPRRGGRTLWGLIAGRGRGWCGREGGRGGPPTRGGPRSVGSAGTRTAKRCPSASELEDESASPAARAREPGDRSDVRHRVERRPACPPAGDRGIARASTPRRGAAALSRQRMSRARGSRHAMHPLLCCRRAALAEGVSTGPEQRGWAHLCPAWRVPIRWATDGGVLWVRSIRSGGGLRAVWHENDDSELSRPRFGVGGRRGRSCVPPWHRRRPHAGSLTAMAVVQWRCRRR